MNERPPETDQWLLSGDCCRCRRAKYCNKPCKASQRRLQRNIMGAAMSMAAELYSKSQCPPKE